MEALENIYINVDINKKIENIKQLIKVCDQKLMEITFMSKKIFK